MLHLLAPHTCPACNGPHRPIPTASELRPYFGTFLQVAGSGAVPLKATANLSTTTPGNSTAWSLTGVSNGGLGTWGASAFTVTIPGHYIGYWFHQPTSSNTGTFNMSLRKGGATQGNSFAYKCNGADGQDTYAGSAEFDAVNGDSIDLFCSSFSGSNGSSSAGLFTIVFIPTPNNRK